MWIKCFPHIDAQLLVTSLFPHLSSTLECGTFSARCILAPLLAPRQGGAGKGKYTYTHSTGPLLVPSPVANHLLLLFHSQGAKVSPVQSDLEDTGKVGAWEKFMKHMVAAVAEGDQTYISLLVLNYQDFFSIQQVLDRVSNRYANSCNLPDRDGRGQECLKNTFSCLLLTWLQEFPDDFCEPPDFSSLKELLSFAQVALLGSALERQAQDLLSWLESLVASETQTQGLVPSMAAEIESAADLKAPVAAPAMPAADLAPPWSPELLLPTPAPEREAVPRPPALPPSEASSSPALEPKLETSPALPAEQVVALMPPQLPPSGLKPVASLDLVPAASPPEAPTEQQEADQVPPAIPSVPLQSTPAVTPPGDLS
ncbi:uncharacterized protein LOC143687189 [Tamandua tetradactyla]|uniref:uncharacterized protein LOC143687189 n=1 Tax=Tamandua tetradactyla TaxID=48850 RepID=UPI004054096E